MNVERRHTPVDEFDDLLIAHSRFFQGSERGFLALLPGIDVLCVCGVAGGSNSESAFDSW